MHHYYVEDAIANLVQQLPSNGLTAAAILWVIKKWLNGKIAKVESIDSIEKQLIQIGSKLDHMNEKMAEFKPAAKKVDEVDKSVAMLERTVEALHRRLDDFKAQQKPVN